MLKKAFMALMAGLVALPLPPAEAGWLGRHKPSAECPVAWEEKTVTAYRPEWKVEVVPVVVNKTVCKVVEEPFKYTEYVSVSVPEKRTVTSYQCVTREVPYTYTVKVPVVISEKRTITTYECVAKQVPYTYTVKVPVLVTEKRTVTHYISVPEVVCEEVPVRKLAKVRIEDPCTGCGHNSLKFVTEYRAKKKIIHHKVPQTKEIEVKVCSYQTEQRTGTKLVYEKVAVQKEITVNVCSHKTEQRTGTKLVQEKVPVTREITVHVSRCQPVEKTGVKKRVIQEQVQETVHVTRKKLECVPYTKTFKVPVYAVPACH